ncbi:hypothetical protein LCGC14_0976190 [marine sediment metagenome]|uniref:Uncharacterized protein n=1 Tax=marine sediment metagenome TaxID=412755 RepID=A0A0F9QTH7_9ZZZZ
MPRKYQRKIASYKKFDKKADFRAIASFGGGTKRMETAFKRANRLSKPKPKRKKTKK